MSADERAARRAELDAARARWAAQGVSSYTFRYSPQCFCIPSDVEVTVIGGQLVATSIQTDGEFGRGIADEGITIEGWFDRIDAAIDTAANVTVAYTDWGYPDSVWVDESLMTADEEWGMTVGGYVDGTHVAQHVVNQSYGCGYGFWTANPSQTLSLRLPLGADGSTPTPGSYDVASLVGAELLVGANLMANWCDDVIEMGEPEPVVDETWALTAGTIELTFTSSTTAVAVVTGLTAEAPDGTTVVLGDAEIRNDTWGQFAG